MPQLDFSSVEIDDALDQEGHSTSALAFGFAQCLSVLSKQSGAWADAVRLSACVGAMVCQAVSQGHVCLPLSLCASRLKVEAGALRSVLLRSGVVFEETAALNACLPLVLDQGDRLYLARYYEYEQRLASRLRALIHRSPSLLDQQSGALLQNKNETLIHFFPTAHTIFQWRDTLSRYCHVLGLADHQRLAVALTALNRLTLISGGPGTGKTTTSAALLACLLERVPTLRVALAAPTGRAAQHLFHALNHQAALLPTDLAARLPQKAFTVHRLLSQCMHAEHSIAETAGSQQDPIRSKTRNTVAHAVSLLPYDLIVIDEASMLDMVLATQLVEAMPPHARLVLLGDKYQLSAVEAGAVFASLTTHPRFTPEYLNELAVLLPENREWLDPESFAFPENRPALLNCCVELERNYRFSKTSPIGCLAQAVRDADLLAAQHALTRIKLDSGPPNQAIQAEEEAVESAILIEENTSPDMRGQPGADRLSAAAFKKLAKGFDAYLMALQEVLFESAKTITSTDTEAQATAIYSSLKTLYAALYSYRILCPVYEGVRGVAALNAGLDLYLRDQLRHALHHNAPPGLSTKARAYLQQIGMGLINHQPSDATGSMRERKNDNRSQSLALYVGLPLMVTCNDYNLDLFNGDIGIVLPKQLVRPILPTKSDKNGVGSEDKEEGALQILFYKADHSIRLISPALLCPCRAAFAMTVHKAQGSEFNHIALVLPTLSDSQQFAGQSSLMSLTRAMLYTAITRARQKVTLLGSDDALKAAISTSPPLYSGLQDRLLHPL